MYKTKLSSFISEYGDGIHGTPIYSDDGEYFFINGNNLEKGIIVIDEDTLKIDYEQFRKISRPLNDRTVLLSINGTLGNTAFYRGENVALGKSACYINIKSEYSKEFFRYILTTKEFQKYMLRVAHGSTIKNFAPSQVGEYEVELPDIEEHENIAKLLSSIDDKIFNNNLICDDLEGMAKLLYDYWFVQFDFPDENGKPYKSSGGKMVWNEELKREIPDGWKVKPLSKVLCLLRDGTHNPPKRIDSGIPLLTGTMFGDYFLDYSQATYITEDDYYTIHKQYKPNAGDIVITKIGTLGNVNYLRDKDIPIAIHCNSALLRFPDDYCGMFAFQYCKSKEFFARLKAAKGQSVQEFCSLDSIGSILMLVPDHKLTARYNDNMKSVLNQMINTQSENQELASLRDFLLPMLMNGQVKVKKEDDNE